MIHQASHTPHVRRLGRAHLLAGGALACALSALPSAALAAPSVPPAAQDARSKRPDQITVRSKRGDSVAQLSAVVLENGLDGVVAEGASGQEKLQSDQVLRIAFGDVPGTYRDGIVYLERGDFALAAGSFRQAANAGQGRAVVLASARLKAAESLLALAAREPAHLAEAAEEAQRFLTDYPTNREVPEASLLRARALRMAGNAVEAAEAYRAIFAKVTGDKAETGWSRAQCYRAGLEGAWTLLGVPDTLAARELFGSVANALGPVVAGLADSPEKLALADLATEASLGEGFVELAAGNAGQALAFFQSQERALTVDSSSALRYGVLLGLGESLLADGQARPAQLALAEVSALEPRNRDRIARALLRQAEAGTRLGDPRESQRALLGTVDRDYGDTSSAAAARQMLQTL